MEKGKKPKVEKPGMEEKREWRVLRPTLEEKCWAVLSVWTERCKPGEVCRDLGMALSLRLAVLLKKGQRWMMKGLGRRLKRLPGNLRAPLEEREVVLETKL